jgi:hypothetical protein
VGGRCRPEGEGVGRARFWVVVVNPQAPPAPAPRRASPFFPLFLKMPREVRPLLTCRPWVRGRRCNERLCNERLLPMILFHEKDMGMQPSRRARARVPLLSLPQATAAAVLYIAFVFVFLLCCTLLASKRRRKCASGRACRPSTSVRQRCFPFLSTTTNTTRLARHTAPAHVLNSTYIFLKGGH